MIYLLPNSLTFLFDKRIPPLLHNFICTLMCYQKSEAVLIKENKYAMYKVYLAVLIQHWHMWLAMTQICPSGQSSCSSHPYLQRPSDVSHQSWGPGQSSGTWQPSSPPDRWSAAGLLRQTNNERMIYRKTQN